MSKHWIKLYRVLCKQSLFCSKIHEGRAEANSKAHASCDLWLRHAAILICSVFFILLRGFSSNRETSLWDCLLYTPYSKMAASLLFFCLHGNQPSLPRQHVQNTKEFWSENEPKRTGVVLLSHFNHASFCLALPSVTSQQFFEIEMRLNRQNKDTKVKWLPSNYPWISKDGLVEVFTHWYLFCLTERDLPTGWRVLCETFFRFYKAIRNGRKMKLRFKNYFSYILLSFLILLISL